MSTTFATTALPAAANSARSDAQTMRFGAFAITETQSFPPAAGAQCWAYLTLNAEIALSLPASPDLQQLIRSPRARISIDGQWLWWALRRKYPQRPLVKLSGSDLIYELAAHCAEQGRKLMLLGSSATNNAAAVSALRKRWPSLQVAGHAPPWYDRGTAAESLAHQKALKAILACKPHYVVLGLGAAKEQRFASEMLQCLDGVVCGLLCFGGAIDLVSGTVQRAPLRWQSLGIEGVYRVLQRPQRIGRLLRVLRVIPLLAIRRY